MVEQRGERKMRSTHVDRLVSQSKVKNIPLPGQAAFTRGLPRQVKSSLGMKGRSDSFASIISSDVFCLVSRSQTIVAKASISRRTGDAVEIRRLYALALQFVARSSKVSLCRQVLPREECEKTIYSAEQERDNGPCCICPA